MANRALQAKAAKARLQRMGVDKIAPRFSDKAGSFRPVGPVPSNGLTKASLRALLEQACEGHHVRKIKAGKYVPQPGKGGRVAFKTTYGDGTRTHGRAYRPLQWGDSFRRKPELIKGNPR